MLTKRELLSFAITVLALFPGAAHAEDQALSCNSPTKPCGTVERYRRVNGFCTAFDKNGKQLGIDFKSTECAEEKPAKYEIRYNSCAAIAADGTVIREYVDQSHCGKIKRHAFDRSYCHAYDREGKDLGLTFDATPCAKDVPVRYETTEGHWCYGITKSGRIGTRALDPSLCAPVHHFAIMDTYCYGFAADGKVIGIQYSGTGCKPEEIAYYETRNGGCSAFSAEGTVLHAAQDPAHCGRIAHYLFDRGYCHAYDLGGNDLGLYFDSTNCKDDRIFSYRFNGIFCEGLTEGGKVALSAADPSHCAVWAMYDVKAKMCLDCESDPAKPQSQRLEKKLTSEPGDAAPMSSVHTKSAEI